MNLVIHSTGEIRCIYDEKIELAKLGTLSITRASHVEPDAAGCWWADLAPLQGPHLGPFTRRTDALRAESDWLSAHWLPA